MSEINTDFYKMSLMMVQNIKDASERDIEKQVMEVASMPTFKEINELDLNFLRKKMINFESKKNTIKQTKKAAK